MTVSDRFIRYLQRTLQDLLQDGDAPGLAKFNPIPWDDVCPSGSLADLIPEYGGGRIKGDPVMREAAVLALLEKARTDGRTDLFATVDAEDVYCDEFGLMAVAYVQPVLALVLHGFKRACEVYLELGFDPAKPAGADGRTGISVAEEAYSMGIAQMFRASVVRKLTDRTIDAALAQMGQALTTPEGSS